MHVVFLISVLFFFNDTATTEIYTLSLHDALPICRRCPRLVAWREEVAQVRRAAYAHETYWGRPIPGFGDPQAPLVLFGLRSEEHTSELQSRQYLVCRLLLEKKKKQ